MTVAAFDFLPETAQLRAESKQPVQPPNNPPAETNSLAEGE